jgi:hypothetical protein
VLGAEIAHFWHHLIHSKPNICQDRLGTNQRKDEKSVFLQAVFVSVDECPTDWCGNVFVSAVPFYNTKNQTFAKTGSGQGIGKV